MQILVNWNPVGGGFFLQILVAQSSRVVSRSDHLARRNRGLFEKKIQMVLFPIVEPQQKVLPLVMPFCQSFIQHHIPVSYNPVSYTGRIFLLCARSRLILFS